MKNYLNVNQDKRENVYFMDYSDFLASIKSICKFMNKSCYQNSFDNFAGFFHIYAKELEYEQLKLGDQENFPSEELIIKPDIPRYGDLIRTIYIKPKCKGIKSILFYFKKIWKIFCNRFGKWFWSYGESIPKIIRASFFLIGIYTGALQLGLLKIVDSSSYLKINGPVNFIYFNIVTFTSLGYGDFRPKDEVSRIFFGCEALLGLLFISLCIYIIGKKSKN